MVLRLCQPLSISFSPLAGGGKKQNLRPFRCSSVNHTSDNTFEHRKLVLEVRDKLEKEYSNLPVGKNGRDDEEMIFWFLKDRKFSVDDAVTKLTKALKWREDFGVSSLSEDSLKSIYGTGKAYVHDFADVYGRPVLVVVASKHFPEKQEALEDQKLCVFLIEKALSKLPDGLEEILVVLDLRDFRTVNADIMFFKFLIDAFYFYYPKRLGQVLLVDAPFVFQPIWQLLKPLLKSYAPLVRFVDAETLRSEFFYEDTLPAAF
ncbi:hypothetical protein KSP40_PGU010148 [Platanthera guangdongensis]|uniref:CRAL-TRIO domain-containing protein n=1 Tax=Platanthera guangdongensis TaxID=2320717 RepID=A0ABR2MM97_9ASPA